MGKFFQIIFFSGVLLAMPVISSLSLSAQNKRAVELKTVVIDPGHGGKDPGTTSGKILEKNITLSVSKKLGSLITEHYPDVRVIYTRKSDKFVELHERAAIANRANADLFISIHVNSVGDRSVSGHESFVMGSEKSGSNLEVCKLENSVVVLEDDYSSKYEGFDPNNPESYIIFSLLQNAHLRQSLDFAALIQEYSCSGPIRKNRGVKQDNFIVLWKCTMPAVLVELGFLSNKEDQKVLVSAHHQNEIAKNIFDAFRQYKKSYDMELVIPDEKGTDKGNVAGVTDKAPSGLSGEEFGIQIMASVKLLKKNSGEFKGYTCNYVKRGNFYKYYIGGFESREAAQRELARVKRTFPEAFIIKIR